ncbi:MAG: PhzF family phenazine biosynthesis protein [Acidobacteria bacterium]|nr:PhzF family phenazine biosynthesis protein [Acidobacteriota bacterium]
MLPFQQVDVFTAVPFKGNPVAVILEGDALTAGEMQTIARWTNLSETTFVCSPTDPSADYRLRIFTPKNELPFAGHPTIGSAHAVLRQGRTPKTAGRLVQQCGKGLIQIEHDGERGFFALPTPRFVDGGEQLRDGLAHALGVAPSALRSITTVDVGPVWITVEMLSADAVLALTPDMGGLCTLMPDGRTGVTVFGLHDPAEEADIEVRSFAPGEGVPEDPVCGSGNGCVAAVVRQRRLIAKREYQARQGRCLGRDGRIAIRFADDGTIWVGGQAVTCVEGVLTV